MDHPIPARRPELDLINKKKITCYQFDVGAPEWKKRQKLNKYIVLGGAFRKLWNVKMTVIPIVVGGPGTVPKNIEKRLDEQEEFKPFITPPC